MVIKYNIKVSDIFYYYLHSFIVFSLAVVSIGFLIIGFLIHVFQQSHLLIINIFASLLVFILVIFSMMIILPYICTVRRKGALGEYTFEITPDYCRGATPYTDYKYDWKVVKIKNSRRNISIFYSCTQIFLIRKRNFSTIEEYNKFYDLTVSYYKQSKKTAS